MLLGAAKYLADTRNFAGTAIVIFQPAEEGGAGARAMIRDGLLDRFGIQKVFGMHNAPSLPVGEFAIRSGPMMASTDTIDIELEGVGGHAGWPHHGDIRCWSARRSSPSCSRSWRAISIRSRRRWSRSACSRPARPRMSFPPSARLRGTARSLSPEVRSLVEKRVREVVEGTARLYGAKANLTYTPGYPILVNEERQSDFAASVAREIAGGDKVKTGSPPVMGGEDFAYMWRNVRARSSGSAMATAPRCITRPTISMTKRSRSGPLLGAIGGNGAGGIRRVTGRPRHVFGRQFGASTMIFGRGTHRRSELDALPVRNY